MFDWKKVWSKKGKLESQDLKLLNGYEKTSINPEKVSKNISKALGINKDTRVLEVGCGAGMIAQFLNCKYVGIDYSASLIEKHRRILNNEVYESEANKLKFKDKSFDCVFAYSVFQYFKDLDYAYSVIEEMKRVSKRSIFIGDLAINSHDTNHLLFKKSMFEKHLITEGYYNSDRFNVLIEL